MCPATSFPARFLFLVCLFIGGTGGRPFFSLSKGSFVLERKKKSRSLYRFLPCLCIFLPCVGLVYLFVMVLEKEVGAKRGGSSVGLPFAKRSRADVHSSLTPVRGVFVSNAETVGGVEGIPAMR
ncbi:hypothetical protein AMTR_s00082p00140750 [Amborella trichopoda]|uniref:Transmembrane protein n=1 Tax=Amborella trichopoda TaxID=13333 RepID=W1NVR7_AMBTC|nr:hypothetical protein AMTR_s00082p00140750 [Amborella trichopoda]